MKRRFLVALTILTTLTSLYAVYAQEVAEEDKILGMSVSSLLVTIPIGMIVIGLLFFVGLYLKDHYKDITYALKSKFRRRKLKGVAKKVADYPRELQDLQKRLPVLEPEDALQRLSSLVKKFFAEKINIDYEFTHRELEKELEKINPNWASLPKRIEYVKYSGEPLSKKEITELMKEFWNIIKYEKRKRISLTLIEKLKKRRLILEIGVLKNLRKYLEKIKPSREEKLTSKDVMKYFAKRQKQRLQNLSDFFKKIKTAAINEIKAQLETINRVVGFFSNKLTERRIDNMLGLLENIRKQINKGRIEQARYTYKQAYQLYYKLPIEEQAHIITELQNMQQKIREYKPQLKIKKTQIDKIKEYIKEFLQQKLTTQTTNKVNNLIEEAQKQINKGQIEQAKNTYKQIYQLYYKLQIEEQAHIITELQNLQQKIREYKPQLKIKKTQIDKIKEYIKEFLQQKLTTQTTNKVNNLIEEAQKQINKRQIEQARITCKQAYQLYYQLPIEEQSHVLYQLKKIKDQITEIEKNKEMFDIEELSKELKNLKSEEDVYIIFDKGGISKKLGSLANYIQKVGEQEIHGIKAGKDHLKEKLKDLAKTAEKVEKEEAKELTHKEKKFLNRIKNIGAFFTKKETALEKTFQQTQKQIFNQIHHIASQIKLQPKPAGKEPMQAKKPVKVKPMPSKPPLPPPVHVIVEKKDVKELAYVERVLLYLKNKREQGLYKIKPSGKEFLDRIESIAKLIKENEQKGVIAFKQYEKEFLGSITSFLRKDKEKHVPLIEEEKRMLGFLEHMEGKEMIQLDEQQLQKEKERLAKPIIELPKIKMDIERLKRLNEEEERIMKELQKMPKTRLIPTRGIPEKPSKKYEWEVMADEIKRKKTKVMTDLLKEEQDIQSKLRELE